MALPNLKLDTQRTEGVTFVVYAPFGTDEVLSTYPDGSSQELAQHPLVRSLLAVAGSGVNVCALIDRLGEDTYLIEIPALKPEALDIRSQWKQDMGAPNTLAGLLRHAHKRHPETAMVLALEGHGAGFLPDLDTSQLGASTVTMGGQIEWHVSQQGATATVHGSPALPQVSPMLPQVSPMLPGGRLPLSTWGLGHALKLAADSGVPKLAAIHFNNCFNMAVEVLHTVAPYAEYATGYMNYNFFTSGIAYPAVFRRLQQQGSATPQALALWFADENHAALAAKGNHPTTGGVVELARMHQIAERVDDLADALLSALRSATASARPAVVSKIRHAIVRSQQYDVDPPMELEAPDELTDLYSFASALTRFDFGPHRVHSAALALQASLQGIKRYGDNDVPWPAPDQRWDFSASTLAMNIFLPDPLLRGQWDWRSPFYLDVNPDPALPRVQPNIIEFLKVTDWVDFIIEYHKETKFVGLLPAALPQFPVFNPHYEPRKPLDPCGNEEDTKGGGKGATAG